VLCVLPCPLLGVTFITGKVDRVQHADGQSTVFIQGQEGQQISGSLVLDATGHSRRLVEFDKKFDPGYQGAYGIIAGAGCFSCSWVWGCGILGA
jgi:lycopene beta-cyclase